jgi:dTDP-glucose 4,6-dehydratase
LDKLLITGAGGFIGSHLTEECVKQGYKVKALIRYNSRNNWGWLEYSDYKEKIEVVTGDIRDYDSIYHAMNEC